MSSTDGILVMKEYQDSKWYDSKRCLRVRMATIDSENMMIEKYELIDREK